MVWLVCLDFQDLWVYGVRRESVAPMAGKELRVTEAQTVNRDLRVRAVPWVLRAHRVFRAVRERKEIKVQGDRVAVVDFPDSPV